MWESLICVLRRSVWQSRGFMAWCLVQQHQASLTACCVMLRLWENTRVLSMFAFGIRGTKLRNGMREKSVVGDERWAWRACVFACLSVLIHNCYEWDKKIHYVQLFIKGSGMRIRGDTITILVDFLNTCNAVSLCVSVYGDYKSNENYIEYLAEITVHWNDEKLLTLESKTNTKDIIICLCM